MSSKRSGARPTKPNKTSKRTDWYHSPAPKTESASTHAERRARHDEGHPAGTQVPSTTVADQSKGLIEWAVHRANAMRPCKCNRRRRREPPPSPLQSWPYSVSTPIGRRATLGGHPPDRSSAHQHKRIARKRRGLRVWFDRTRTLAATAAPAHKQGSVILRFKSSNPSKTKGKCCCWGASTGCTQSSWSGPFGCSAQHSTTPAQHQHGTQVRGSTSSSSGTRTRWLVVQDLQCGYNHTNARRCSQQMSW